MKYIRPGLEVLEEVQGTGDIFFPKNWAGSFAGQSSQFIGLRRSGTLPERASRLFTAFEEQDTAGSLSVVPGKQLK